MDIITLALAKRYTEKSIAGVGALKGEKGDKGDKGDPGDNYILTDEDKNNIAELAIARIEYGDERRY